MECTFLNIPSPEQGASTNILSKYPSNLSASFSGASLTTTAFFIPNSSTFFTNALALDALMSLLTSSPSPFSFAPSSVVFPPGAAHKSRTLSPGLTSSKAAGSMAEGS